MPGAPFCRSMNAANTHGGLSESFRTVSSSDDFPSNGHTSNGRGWDFRPVGFGEGALGKPTFAAGLPHVGSTARPGTFATVGFRESVVGKRPLKPFDRDHGKPMSGHST